MARTNAHAAQTNAGRSDDLRLRAIAYGMDCLIPGVYIWLGSFKFWIGGSEPEDNYRGTVHSYAGIALVMAGYRIYSTYQGSYDP